MSKIYLKYNPYIIIFNNNIRFFGLLRDMEKRNGEKRYNHFTSEEDWVGCRKRVGWGGKETRIRIDVVGYLGQMVRGKW